MFLGFITFASTAYAITADTVLARIESMIVQPLISFMFAVALLVFIWGAAQFISNQGGGEEKKLIDGKNHMLWGLVGILIMISVYGIMRITINTFGLTGPKGAITLPVK
jgi:hypothetical protein